MFKWREKEFSRGRITCLFFKCSLLRSSLRSYSVPTAVSVASSASKCCKTHGAEFAFLSLQGSAIGLNTIPPPAFSCLSSIFLSPEGEKVRGWGNRDTGLDSTLSKLRDMEMFPDISKSAELCTVGKIRLTLQCPWGWEQLWKTPGMLLMLSDRHRYHWNKGHFHPLLISSIHGMTEDLIQRSHR